MESKILLILDKATWAMIQTPWIGAIPAVLLLILAYGGSTPITRADRSRAGTLRLSALAWVLFEIFVLVRHTWPKSVVGKVRIRLEYLSWGLAAATALAVLALLSGLVANRKMRRRTQAILAPTNPEAAQDRSPSPGAVRRR